MLTLGFDHFLGFQMGIVPIGEFLCEYFDLFIYSKTGIVGIDDYSDLDAIGSIIFVLI